MSEVRLVRERQWTLGERPESHTECCALGKEQQMGSEKSEVKDRTQSDTGLSQKETEAQELARGRARAESR